MSLDRIDRELRQSFQLPGGMPEVTLDHDTTALLVIDMHHLDAHRDGEFGRRARAHGIADRVEWFFRRVEETTVPAIARLLESARAAGIDVLHTRIAALTPDGRDLGWRYRHWGLTASVDDWESQFLPEIAPRPGEIVINKTTTSAFIGSHIDRILRNLGIHHLVICGVMTSGCVESTVRDAADSGYHVIVPEEACAALSRQAHQNAINSMHPVFATVEPIDEVVARFARAGRHRDRGVRVTGTARVTVAAVQTNPRLGDVAGNLDRIVSWIRRAADAGAELVVFPECAVNGYRYESRDEALADAEPVPGPATGRLEAAATETGVHAAVGIVERDGDRLYNCAALIGPRGLVTKYRKTHIPFQAVDRFVAPGDIPLHVVETPVGRVGMVICYDLRFPEPARVLALSGVQIIANLTNLPPPGWVQPEFIFRARAAENRVWLVCADRVGTERGVEFIGRSAIVSPAGVTLAEAGESGEEMLVQQIVPEEADMKDLVFDPGVYEMHLLRDRRVDLYGGLTASELPTRAGR